MHLEDAFLDKLQWKDHLAFNHIFRLNKFSAEVQVPSSKLSIFFFLDITIKNSVIPFFQETSENMRFYRFGLQLMLLIILYMLALSRRKMQELNLNVCIQCG